MAKKWICTVCGYVAEGENPPAKCPQCGVPASKFKELKEDGTFDKIVGYYIDGTEEKGYESPADVDHSNGKLVMATNAAFEPYEYYEDNKIVGVDVDFAQAIADKLGMELTVNDMEFDSIIAAVDSGKADFGAAGMTVTKEREKQVDFSDSYYTGKQMIIVKK